MLQAVQFRMCESDSAVVLPDNVTRRNCIRVATVKSGIGYRVGMPPPVQNNARYILALMLERKKALFPVGIKETESSKLLLYEHRLTGDVLIVRDPQLKLDEVEKVQEEVSQLLDQNHPNKESDQADSNQTSGEESTADTVDTAMETEVTEIEEKAPASGE